MLRCETCHNVYQCPACEANTHTHAHGHEHREHRSNGNQLSELEVEALKATKSIHDWRKVVEEIRANRSGSLPEDWMRVVLGRGGIAVSIIESWKEGSS